MRRDRHQHHRDGHAPQPVRRLPPRFRQQRRPVRRPARAAALRDRGDPLVALRGLMTLTGRGAHQEAALRGLRCHGRYAAAVADRSEPVGAGDGGDERQQSGATMATMALAAGAQRSFLMGYAYRGPGSDTVGSISPIDNPLGLESAREPRPVCGQGCAARQGHPGAAGLRHDLGDHRSRAALPSRSGQRLGTGSRVPVPARCRHAVPSGAKLDSDPVDSSARISVRPGAASGQTYYDTPATLRTKYRWASNAGWPGGHVHARLRRRPGRLSRAVG